MHETASFPSFRSFPTLGRVALMAVAAAAFIPSVLAGPGPFGVVLANGRTIVAVSRPLIAMGQVSFLDGDRRSRTLGLHEVDVAATQARNGAFTVGTAHPWTARALAHLDRHGVQFVGAAPSQASEGSTDGMTDAEKIRSEIDRMNKLMQPLSGTDHQRTVYIMRRQELQEELERVLSPAPTQQTQDQGQS